MLNAKQKINVNQIIDYLSHLVKIPSPSGFASAAITYCANVLDELGVTYQITKKGALLATLPGTNTKEHRLLTAHVDTLGAMVKDIKSNGRLKLTNIGGFRWNSVEGEYCQIHTASGHNITGTIVHTKASVHVYRDHDQREDTNMEVRIDAVVKNAEDTRKLGIEVGDFVSFDPRLTVSENGFIKSRHLDDKASVAILLELMKQISEQKLTLPYTTHFLISNNEEIGYGGNSNVPEQTVEYIAVDMGAIGDGQSTDEFCASICAKDSSGPYHYELRQKLIQCAQQEDVYYKVDIYPYYGSDASAAIRAGYDIKHGLIGPGIDASHAHERTHQDSLINTAALLYTYLLSK